MEVIGCKKTGLHHVCVTQESTRRVIKWGFRNPDFSLRYENYFLSFPKVIFNIGFEQYRWEKQNEFTFKALRFAFCGKKGFFYPSLYNIDNSCGVCIECSKSQATLSDLVKSVISKFWQDAFSTDLPWCISQYANSGLISSYKLPNGVAFYKADPWQKLTKADPNWTPKESQLVRLEEDWVLQSTDYDWSGESARCNLFETPIPLEDFEFPY